MIEYSEAFELPKIIDHKVFLMYPFFFDPSDREKVREKIEDRLLHLQFGEVARNLPFPNVLKTAAMDPSKKTGSLPV